MKIRKITALVVIVVLFSTSFAFAGSNKVKNIASAYDAGVYFYKAAKDMKKTAEVIVNTDDDFDTIIEDVRNGFSAYKAHSGESLSVLQNESFNYKKYTDEGITKVKITFSAKYKLTSKQYKEYQSKLKSVVKSLNLSGKSDKEKVRVIYKYICKNTKYRNEKNADRTAYGVIVKGCGSCEGISAAFYDMCKKAGIKCAVIYGGETDDDKISHSWNIVKIDDKWYNCDATWDLGKKSNFKYLLKSDEYFEYTEHFRSSYFKSEEFTKNHRMCSPAGNWLKYDISAAA